MSARICFECGAEAECDHHVVPRSLGGTRTVPLCEVCHGKVHGCDMVGGRRLTKAALAAKKARGEMTGSAPYGFRLGADGKTLVRDEAEQAVLAEVAERRGAGMSIRAIVAALAARGFASRGGRPFAIASVHAMAQGAA